MIPPGQETYIGDGVYVSHDGYQIWLRADSQRIALEPQVWADLLRWVKRLDTLAFPVVSQDP